MQPNDYPFGVRVLVAVTVLLSIVAGIIVLAGASGIAAILSDRTLHPSVWTGFGSLLGAIIGSLGTLWITRSQERRRQEREARDITISLHAELADRASRCVSDFLWPWRHEGHHDEKYKRGQTRAWVAKFRPVDPVVYPAVASKLALVHPDGLYPLVQFYFRLDALQREIDQIISDFGHDVVVSREDFKRLRLVAARFQQCLAVALLALERLNVEGWEQLESEAIRSYEHARKAGKPLRQLLREHKRDDL